MAVARSMRGLCSGLLTVVVCSSAAAQSGYFGAAQISINPTTPIRLSGYAARDPLPEASGMQQMITAQAAAFGTGAQTSLLIAVDSTGVPDNVVDSVSAALSANYGLARERIVITSTHTHSGPHIDGFAANIFDPATARALTLFEQQHITTYTTQLSSWLQQVAANALNNRAPGHYLHWGQGSVGFGQNRRGRAIAPNDHDLPMLRVTDSLGTTTAILTSYATHATTLNHTDNLVSGDWPGYARQSIQSLYPGAVALVMIGAGGDSDPQPRLGANAVAHAQNHGQAVANEVQRLINQQLLTPVSFDIAARHSEVDLPFATAREPGDPLSARLAPSAGSISYGVTSWSFGDDLAMAFLEGELTVDYSLRLKSEFNDGRLWVNGFANDVQAYIPSERILYEGGYEADDSSYWYAQPGRFAHGIENTIVGAVRDQLSPFFNPADRLRLLVNWGTGEAVFQNTTDDAIEFDAYTITSAAGRLNPTSGGWWSLQDQGAAGWDEADNSSSSRLTEFGTAGGLVMPVDAERSLGRLHTPSPPANFGDEPAAADLTFHYAVPGAGSKSGLVAYTGPHNNLVLTIDPATGGAAIRNESPFFDVAIEAYTIQSESGRLRPQEDRWDSLQDQSIAGWDEAANSNSFRITEFNPDGETFLTRSSTVLSLGEPIDIAVSPFGAEDFAFEFALSDGRIMTGVVVLGLLPTLPLPGDYDQNGVIETADYDIWRAAYGMTVLAGSGADGNGNGVVDAADYVLWRNHWSGGSASARALIVSEVSMCAAALILMISVCHTRQRRVSSFRD